MKFAIDEYLETVNHKLNYKPPVPHFGFFMRNTLVTQFPAMRVNVDPPQDVNSAPLILRHDIIGNDMLLGFLGDLPEPNGVLKALTITLLPHQQFLSAGVHANASDIVMNYNLDRALNTNANKKSFDEKATPVMMAIQLNAPAWQLAMNVPGIEPVSHLPTLPGSIMPLSTSEITPWPDKIAIPNSPDLGYVRCRLESSYDFASIQAATPL
ncbi:hypothetical protein P153DRAFT_397357 [Dothidotthia symphoricarpi CBS 119687]|uniref:Uncharacterized protein n=1 Tax=Dothidotthia symphoricarpi CBS 119687 TaxID=1392245 RepID=A0A6A6A8U9_9PLEO|nr:uncharacterized protein P153DRAFT_397357 [Dothidotthia symphoricarpi CBS 119687]KAF2128260.1 hypothetical protein P153DRAFT_397357 [Dothidotthia symphoricarpi CBS 119687]